MRFERMRTDYRLAVLTMFGAVGAIGVLPFAWYRLARGELVAGAADLGIVLALFGVVAHAWRGGDIGGASRVFVLVAALGCVLITHVVGLAGVLWSYPLVVGSFLLVGRAMATAVLVAAITLVTAIAVHRHLLPPGPPVVMYMSTILVAGLFSLLFAERTRWQHRKLEELAMRDPLTDALNRRAMKRELQLAVEAKARHGAEFGLAMLDVDDFKRINDAHGHEAGDQVLLDLVALIRAHVRKLDQVYRMGGEEFLVLFTAVDAAALPGLCDSLRAAIARELRGGGLPVTASIGCAMLQPGETMASWLARADAAMYAAKHLGRNRVEVASPVRASYPGGPAPAD
ncbi:MAG TPA: GGDEF domain-containing protein [Xanthomonadaceae bacterium]|nr:GGDEF domain-containing protein [Xanthomonadaceae bacterium]